MQRVCVGGNAMDIGKKSLLKTLRYFVYSMADPRRDLAHDIRKYSGPLIEHLLFLIYFKDNPAYPHWRGEAFGFIPHQVSVFKGTHKFPKQDFLDQALFLWLIDSDAVQKNFVYAVSKKGFMLPLRFESSLWESLSKIGSVLHEVTGILAKDRVIHSEQFYDILDRHGL
jgi:hypothetical protein